MSSLGNDPTQMKSPEAATKLAELGKLLDKLSTQSNAPAAAQDCNTASASNAIKSVEISQLVDRRVAQACTVFLKRLKIYLKLSYP